MRKADEALRKSQETQSAKDREIEGLKKRVDKMEQDQEEKNSMLQLIAETRDCSNRTFEMIRSMHKANSTSQADAVSRKKRATDLANIDGEEENQKTMNNARKKTRRMPSTALKRSAKVPIIGSSLVISGVHIISERLTLSFPSHVVL